MTDEETLQERVAALEATVAEVSDRLDRVVNRDIPPLKGTVRAAVAVTADEIQGCVGISRRYAYARAHSISSVSFASV